MRFGLLEVIVVLFVVAVLGTLAIPAVFSAREAARMAQCENNVRQIGLGVLTFEHPNRAYPYGTIQNADLAPDKRWSWYIGAWGYVLDGQIGLEIDRKKAWDTPANLAMTTHVRGENDEDVVGHAYSVHLLLCPAGPRLELPSGIGQTNYVGMAGNGLDAAVGPLAKGSGIFGYDRQCTKEDLRDGAEFTLLVIETGDNPGPWTAGGPATVRGADGDKLPLLGYGRQFGGLHRQKAIAGMADGSGRVLSDDMDPTVFLGLTTIDDGEREQGPRPAVDLP